MDEIQAAMARRAFDGLTPEQISERMRRVVAHRWARTPYIERLRWAQRMNVRKRIVALKRKAAERKAMRDRRAQKKLDTVRP